MVFSIEPLVLPFRLCGGVVGKFFSLLPPRWRTELLAMSENEDGL